MSYCLSPHDREVLERAYRGGNWGAVRELLNLDLARRAQLEDNGFTPCERRLLAKYRAARERDEGDAA